jgi:hypothetical protein
MRSTSRSLRRSLFVAAVSAFAVASVGPAAAQSIPGPLKVTDSGPSGSPGYAIKGITGFANDAGVFGYGTVASSAINIDGVVGYVQTQQSVGVVGWAQSTGTTASGVYGYSATGPGVYGFNANGAAASIYGYSTAGNAVYGISTGGIGVDGESSVSDGVAGTTSTNPGSGNAGVMGTDTSLAPGSTGENYGVAGTSAGGAGVAAFSTGFQNGGQALLATSYSGNDGIDVQVFGYEQGNSALTAYTDTGSDAGLFLSGVNSYVAGSALIANSFVSQAKAVLATNDGVGAEFFGQSGTPDAPVIGAYEENPATAPFVTYNLANAGVGYYDETFMITDTVNYSGDAAPTGSDVNVSGDLYVRGRIYTDCGGVFPTTAGSSCSGSIGLVKTVPSGAKFQTYGASQSLPTMEDFGEAQMTSGQAAVPLERSFAQTIDSRRSYLVFLTPEGDCNGLYVAGKTPSGFVVRELRGGHSTLTFQYRIVAHPYGDSSTRLASIGAKSATDSHHDMSRVSMRLKRIAEMLQRSRLRVASLKQAPRLVAPHPQHVPPPVVSSNLFKH